MATAPAMDEADDYLVKTETGKRPKTVADLMTPAVGLFSPETTVAQAVEQLRVLTRNALITYLYIVDPQQRLLGLVVMREMLLATPDTPLSAVMI